MLKNTDGFVTTWNKYYQSQNRQRNNSEMVKYQITDCSCKF